jgi:hypothetical protein
MHFLGLTKDFQTIGTYYSPRWVSKKDRVETVKIMSRPFREWKRGTPSAPRRETHNSASESSPLFLFYEASAREDDSTVSRWSIRGDHEDSGALRRHLPFFDEHVCEAYEHIDIGRYPHGY